MHFMLCCRGNTCRSPMAEAILTNLIQQKLPGVAENHIKVSSSGTHCLDEGGPINSNAIECLTEHKLSCNITSNQLSARLASDVDYILCMDESNVSNVKAILPETSQKICLLGSFGEQGTSPEIIADPFGGSYEEYKATYEQIEQHCQLFMSAVILPNYLPA